uniref:Uncharacterized protein n=1 Tax=Arundo donax TaxID=35708 RepID=A0A0A8ZWA1_ARUDO
MARSAPARGAC